MRAKRIENKMKLPRRPSWARCAAACGIVAAATIPAVTAQARQTPGIIDPGEVECVFATPNVVGSTLITNVTPVYANAPGYALMGVGRNVATREVASVNFGPDTVDPNLALVTLTSSSREICFKNSNQARLNLIVDQLGWLSAGVFAPATAEGEPIRIIDTRINGGQPVGPNGRVCYDDTPNSVMALNVVSVNATADGHGVFVPGSSTNVPNAAHVNYERNSINPNLVIAQADATGKICFANSPGATTDVVVDLVGRVMTGFTAPASGTPVRVLDTRSDAAGAIKPGERRCFTVPGNRGDGAAINLTPVRASAAGDGILVSSDITQRPRATNVNFAPGTIDPNMAIPEIGADGKVCFFNSQFGTVDLVADYLGTFENAAFDPVPLVGATEPFRFDNRPVRIPYT